MRLSTVILPSQRWGEARSMWGRADDFGLHAAYTYDHLSWRNFRERPWFTMIPTLVAAAGVTSSIRLGPLVTSPNFRHPLVLAKDLLALDDVSGGRLTIGVGSGGTGFDATALGQDPWSPAERHRRFEEFTRFLDEVLREPATTLEGAYYRVIDSRQIPGPVQSPRPPIYLSALGPKTMALTAKIADGWVSLSNASSTEPGSTLSSVKKQVAAMNETLAQHGRAEDSIERVFLDFEGDENPLESFEAFIDWAGRYRELGFDELVVHWPIADSQFDNDPHVFERIATEGREIIRGWSA
jgi:alkanesulfonate monooxygenase SsuD/methylene tetrahydromethanopterin reductase-like flavin-dependent oxidoreductase (luciferase family)